MKTKPLILPLVPLLFLPTNLMAAYKNRRVQKTVDVTSKVVIHVPLAFDFIAEGVGDALQLVIVGSLPDSEVAVTGKGAVWKECWTW